MANYPVEISTLIVIPLLAIMVSLISPTYMCACSKRPRLDGEDTAAAVGAGTESEIDRGIGPFHCFHNPSVSLEMQQVCLIQKSFPGDSLSIHPHARSLAVQKTQESSKR